MAVALLVLSGDWLAAPTLTRQTAHTSLPRGQKNGVSQRQPRDIPSPAPPSSDPPETARREVEWETDGSTTQTMCYGRRNKNNSRLGSQALGRGFSLGLCPTQKPTDVLLGTIRLKDHATPPQGPQVLAIEVFQKNQELGLF